MPRAPRTYEIPAVRTEAQLLPDIKQGKPKEKKIFTRPLHERYDLAIIKAMICLLQMGYSLEDYNLYVQGEDWKTTLTQDGVTISFSLEIGLPFYFGVRDEESITQALLRDLLKLREDIEKSRRNGLRKL